MRPILLYGGDRMEEEEWAFDFGMRLQKLRKQRGLTQAQVARRIHVVRGTISAYENNLKDPTAKIITRLASFYNVSADYILGLTSKPAVYVDGLTPEQREALEVIIDGMRKK